MQVIKGTSSNPSIDLQKHVLQPALILLRIRVDSVCVALAKEGSSHIAMFIKWLSNEGDFSSVEIDRYTGIGTVNHYSMSCNADAQVGVCYGRIGNNLPPEQDVVNLYKSSGIARMRLYDPDQKALQALRGSSIGLILDVPKPSLQSLGDPSAASQWVQSNVQPYASDVNFRYISVGNEIEPSDAEASSVLPAMQNILRALQSANLAGQIKVSTAIKMDLITNSYPPSNGVFTGPATQYITPIINFLKSNGSPLLVNVYPYFSYTDNPQQIALNYALFQPGTTVTDGSLQYYSLFDALVDAVYAALAKVGAPNVPIVVSESGWPSAGNNAATPQNAGTYYQNLINHVKQGTPKKPGAIETYLFAMFDENLKDAGVEQHFGLFTPFFAGTTDLN